MFPDFDALGASIFTAPNGVKYLDLETVRIELDIERADGQVWMLNSCRAWQAFRDWLNFGDIS